MKASINYHIFTQTSLDSGSLTMLGAVIHRFSDPGEYLGTVLRGDQTVGGFHLTVDEKCPGMQANIDLANLQRLASERTNEECRRPRFEVNPKGYAVFYVSQGPGGYAVRVGRFGSEREADVFDSRKLTEGDLFAVTMIRPGTYSVVNVIPKTEGQIVVAYPAIGKTPYRPPDPVTIECTEKEFNPREISIRPGQGQVYQIKTPSRIKIELVKPDDGPEARAQKKVARWSKPPTG